MTARARRGVARGGGGARRYPRRRRLSRVVAAFERSFAPVKMETRVEMWFVFGHAGVCM